MTSMILISEDRMFSLSNAQYSYVMRVSPEGFLESVYYGEPLSRPLEAHSHQLRTERGLTVHFEGVRDYNLSETPQEYPTFGRSDFRYPALHMENADGNSVFSFHYKSYKISHEKSTLEGLPSARGGECETLVLTLLDALHNIELELSYTIYKHHGALVRSSKITNISSAAIKIDHAYSASLNLPMSDYELLHLHGTWAREFNMERVTMPTARFVIGSARGASSAVHNPFLAAIEKGTSETHGKVYATTIIYSGNHSFSAERGEYGDVRILAGINPFNFSWRLEAGESFQTPEALHVFSGNGLRKMSRIWHDFIRDKVIPERFKSAARPTYLNTWEASYFDIDEHKVLHLADKAKEIGVDMLVLDDGWFEGRRDDTSSLGDWVADKQRFPSGIPALAKKVKAKGLKFGIWVEPEMVNPQSALFKKHPDWALQVPGRKSSLGRNQLTLDMSRDDVREHVFDQIDAILSCGDIDYVKWDMNRNMTEVGSTALPQDRQSEVSHRYILGLYTLVKRLTDKYPSILFENCASGGNRFDLGMLSFMAQGWISDMCDPIGRLEIINGASLLYPLDVTAAYIGPSPNHQNGRISSIQTRFMAGIFCAAKGVSLNEADIDAHSDELQALMTQAKDMAPHMLGGQFDRLIMNDNETCWQYTTADESKIYVAYFHKLAAPNLPFRRAHLVGLDQKARYTLAGTQEGYMGDALIHNGLPLPYVSTSHVKPNIRYLAKGDFSSHLFELNKEGSH